MDTQSTFAAIRACAIAMMAGHVVQAESVSAGRGMVIDWRTVRSGDTIQTGTDAFDTAQLFVALVGADAALVAADEWGIEPASAVHTQPRIVEFMRTPNGGRRRSFECGKFTVVVEPHADDEEQAEFTARLAELCAELVN